MLSAVRRSLVATRAQRAPLLAVAQRRAFGSYEGQNIRDEDLVPDSNDWMVEETNFCFGRSARPRFKETDDLYRRVQHIMNCQLNRMHTRLRDGTVIAYTDLYPDGMCDKPCEMHQFSENPVMKWTWDEAYEEAYDPPGAASYAKEQEIRKGRGH